MTIKELIDKKKSNYIGLERLSNNPNNKENIFIANPEEIRIEEIRAYKAWLTGNGNKILNFYTGNNFEYQNFLYDRNIKSSFWSISAVEWGIKRIHSGVVKASIDTLSNVIGIPKITCGDRQSIWDKFAEEDEIYKKMIQLGRPLTLGVGYGAWKPNFDKDTISWEFYDAENIEYIYKPCGNIIGIMFKTYFKADKKDYFLLETRYKDGNSSHIEYDLYVLTQNNTLIPVSDETYKKLVGLENVVINGLDEILAIPSKYVIDPQNTKYGLSILAGKLEVADALDEVLSIVGETCRTSMPIEYVDKDLLERDKEGNAKPLNKFIRHFIKKEGTPDGEGAKDDSLQITQPDLYFDKYINLAQTYLDYFFMGYLSPSTMGIDVAKKDNADAQREKEKVTIMTGRMVRDSESVIWKKMVKLTLMINEWQKTNNITLEDYNDISVKFDEFANPSFESELQVLGTAYSNGEISTKQYVDLLWGDNLSEEEKQQEIEWLDNQRQSDNFDLDNVMGEMNEESTKPDVPGADEDQEQMEEGKKPLSSDSI